METARVLRAEAADLFERLDALGLKQRDLAAALGLDENKISKARSGERQFKASEVLRAQAWFSTFKRISDEGVAQDHDLVEITEIDLSYGLGGTYLDGPVSIETRQFSRAWLRNFTDAPADLLFWTKGDGDSMEPTIRSGEVILIDRSQNTARMSDAIWALAMGEIGMIKRLHFPGQGRIELHSDNDRVPPIAVALDELHVVGRVVAIVRKL